MKIAMLVMGYQIPSEISGGLAPNFHYISKCEADQGNDVAIFTNGNKREYQEVEGVQVWRIPVRRVRRLSFGADLIKEVQSSGFEPDIIHAMNPMPFGWQFRENRKLIKAKYVLSVHTPTIRFEEGLRDLRLTEFSLLLNHLIMSVDMVLAISKFNAGGLLQRGLPPHRLRIVPSGLDLDIFTPRGESIVRKDDSFEVLYVGRFASVKRLGDLIEAATILRNHQENFKFKLIGGQAHDDEYHHVIREIKGRKLENMVQVIPPILQHELPAHYRSADVFVLPSIIEALGKVLLEAMACGTPVVGPSQGGAAELITEGMNGLLYDPGDPSSMAQALLKIACDEGLKRRMGKRAIRYVKPYDWESIARGYLKSFSTIL